MKRFVRITAFAQTAKILFRADSSAEFTNGYPARFLAKRMRELTTMDVLLFDVIILLIKSVELVADYRGVLVAFLLHGNFKLLFQCRNSLLL